MRSGDITANLPAPEAVQALLKYLPYFEDQGRAFGAPPDVRVKGGPAQIVPASLSGQAKAFVRACYDNGFVQGFDWPRWQGKAARLLRDEEVFFRTADLATLIKLLTTHIRKDRFVDGHLLCVMKSGHIGRILRRLRDLFVWIDWKPRIDRAVADACVEIIREPLLYFSEADVQQLLVERLRQIEPLSKTYPTAVHKGRGSKGKYRTSLVHREYGGGGGTRIDVAVLSPADVAQIDNANLTKRGRYLHPVYAFEIGTEKTSDTRRHLDGDLKKLATRSQGTGYAIHIFRDTTRSASGTESRRRTDARLERDFKNVVAHLGSHAPANVKVVTILIRIGREQTRTRGKCGIFDGSKWRKVNVGNRAALRRVILGRLR